MNLLVCVKQVVGENQAQFTEKTNVLDREHLPDTLNVFDTFALGMAVLIKTCSPTLR